MARRVKLTNSPCVLILVLLLVLFLSSYTSTCTFTTSRQATSRQSVMSYSGGPLASCQQSDSTSAEQLLTAPSESPTETDGIAHEFRYEEFGSDEDDAYGLEPGYSSETDYMPTDAFRKHFEIVEGSGSMSGTEQMNVSMFIDSQGLLDADMFA